MSHYGMKIPKGETPDKTPYTVYYPHSKESTERNWNQGWYQVVSIDPARKNYAMRIERRYTDGSNKIIPIVFDKVSIESNTVENGTTICNTYQVLTAFLNKYKDFYFDCHFIIVERQIPDNYKAVRISQHTISYFCLLLQDSHLLPSIIEVDPKLKGKMLGAPKGITPKQLKTWAVEITHKILHDRNDEFSLGVLKFYRNKQDDLSDTVCQIEALFILWGYSSPPVEQTDKLITNTIKKHQQGNILSMVSNVPTRNAEVSSSHNIPSPIIVAPVIPSPKSSSKPTVVLNIVK